MTDRALAAAIQKGAAYIHECQLPDGSFASYTSAQPADFTNAAALPAIFLTSNVLTALAEVDNAGLAATKRRSSTFLLAQKSKTWSFNYWTRSSRRYTEQPYPDDLDDTFCSLAALWHIDPGRFTGDVLAATAHVLIATEQQPGGPYRTWLAAASAGKHWQDIDLAVNANVGYFLSLQDVTVPGITQLIETAIQRDTYTSLYYPEDTMPLYFICRWYHGELRSTLLQHVIQRQRADGTGIDKPPLRTALSITSSLRLGHDPATLEPSISNLLHAQQSDGSWPAHAFCLDPAIDGTTYYAGSAALTTALCLEALHCYAQTQKHSANVHKENKPYQLVVSSVRRDVDALPHADLKRQTGQVLRRILRLDEDQQIVLLPWLVARGAHVPTATATLQQLATASLWGWMAYTVYDDFLDMEGDPLFLPSANLCLRRLTAVLHSTLPDSAAFQQEVRAVLDRLDGANSWELTHCRGELRGDRLYIRALPEYRDYWQLADRSLGHTIAGLGVLYDAGLDQSAPQFQALRNFFKHYLIARQLNDDARDWEDDLQYGHINAAADLVLRRWLVGKNHTLARGIPLRAGRNKLQFQRIMWEEVIVELCDLIDKHIAQARHALTSAGSSFDPTPCTTLLLPLERAAQSSRAKRQETAAFLNNF